MWKWSKPKDIIAKGHAWSQIMFWTGEGAQLYLQGMRYLDINCGLVKSIFSMSNFLILINYGFEGECTVLRKYLNIEG